MNPTNAAETVTRIMAYEARGLLARLATIRPFALYEPMVPAAALTPAAQTAIEAFLARGRNSLRRQVHGYLRWLESDEAREAGPEEIHRRFVQLRLRFNVVIAQFDLFSDAITQRSEHDTGVWLSGLDTVAQDALALPERCYDSPPVVCYLTRGPGAAIRRARTRLPGRAENPVAIIQMPRERMVGSGIASSLVHEVGHQAAALLGLVESLRPILGGRHGDAVPHSTAWWFWDRWISEIVADFWSVAKLGIGSTLGLIAVVSLPRAFVFRLNVDDPHPMPWLRVRLSCAMGNALFPHPQWRALAGLWEQFYPLESLGDEARRTITMLEAAMPEFVGLLADHRPPVLRGKSLREALAVDERTPERLAMYARAWKGSTHRMRNAPPTLAFAVLGQARFNGIIPPEEESGLLGYLLKYWALRSTLDTSAICSDAAAHRVSGRAVQPQLMI